MPDCENCNERCPQAEMAHEIALGRMYATKELIKLVKKIESGQLVEVVRCRECKHYATADFDGDIMCGCTLPSAMLDITPDDFCSYGERKDGDCNG